MVTDLLESYFTIDPLYNYIDDGDTRRTEKNKIIEWKKEYEGLDFSTKQLFHVELQKLIVLKGNQDYTAISKILGLTIVTSGRVYEHDGNRYTVVSISKFKHPVTRKWVDAVSYRPENVYGELYHRVIEDFVTDFKEVVNG